MTRAVFFLPVYFALCGILCACSVLRIDVDVYKGPLSNEPTVQDKQLPVMITGAKPLLIRLREALDPDSATTYTVIQRQKFFWNYDPKIPDAPAARAVNDVLALYEDKYPPILAKFFEVTDTRVPAYAAALRNLAGVSDSALLDQFEAAKSFPSTDTALLNCWTHYHNFLDPIYARSHLYTATDLISSCDIALPKSARNASGDSSNATFRLLASGDVVQMHATALFGSADSPIAKAFIAAVIKKAAAFQSAREDLRAIWEEGLNTLAKINYQTAKDGKPPVSDEIRENLAVLIARLTQVRFLNAEFCREEKTSGEAISPLLAELRKRTNDPTTKWDTPNHYFTADEFALGREALKHALVLEPRDTIDWLRDVDRRFRNAKLVPPPCNYGSEELLPSGQEQPRGDSPERRIYGLLHGPSVKQQDLAVSLDVSSGLLADLVYGVAPGTADGFDAGRLPEGLETIINSYLLTQRNGDVDGYSDAADAIRDRLRTAVVQFAEKLLLLTNSESLFRQKMPLDEDAERNLGSSPTKSQSDRAASIAQWQSYVPLLQAVANGLLVQAQELEAYSIHKTATRDRTVTEEASARSAQSEGAIRYLDQLVASLQKNPSEPVVSTGGPPPPVLTQKPVDVTAEQKLVADETKKVADANALTGNTQAAFNVAVGSGGPTILTSLDKEKALTPAMVVAVVLKWLDTQISSASNAKPDPGLLAAKAYFNSEQFPTSPAAASPSEAYALLIAGLKANLGKATKAAAVEAKKLADAKTALKKAQGSSSAPRAVVKGPAGDATASPPNQETPKVIDEDTKIVEQAKTASDNATAAYALLVGSNGPTILQLLNTAKATSPSAVGTAVKTWIDAQLALTPKPGSFPAETPAGSGGPAGANRKSQAATNPPSPASRAPTAQPATAPSPDAGLVQAKTYFTSAKLPASPSAASPAEAYALMVARIAKAASDAAKSLSSAQLALKNETKPSKPPPPAKPTTPETSTAEAATAIEDAIPTVLGQLRSTGLSSPTTAYFGLVVALSSGAKSTGKAAALAELKKRGPPTLVIGSVAAPGASTNSTDVLDSVIASLRYQQIEASAEGDTPRKQALADALKAAYDYRASMIYIRPASAYLRSAYPASVFQQDNGVAWHNMLSDEAERGSPFASEWMANGTAPWIRHSDETAARINAAEENDKQAWQNINTVKVSGAALTNYVVTQDDIGNWYVKAYSANPKTVTDAATQLALYNFGIAGSAVGAAASKSSGAAGPTPTQAASTLSPSPAPNVTNSTSTSVTSTGVQRIVDKYQTAYTTQTKADFDRALKLDGEFQVAISDAWTANKSLAGTPEIKSFQTNLTTVVSKLKTQLALLALPKDEAKAAKIDLGAQIGVALEDVIAAFTSLKAMLTDDKETASSTTTASNAAARVARDLVSRFTLSRQETVKEFSTAVTVAGESTN
jgi:hypothetical protein